MSRTIEHRRRLRLFGLLAACLGLAAAGCVRDNAVVPQREANRKPAALRVYLASEAEQPDWPRMTDRLGQTVYVSPIVELDQADVASALALHSDKRSIVQVRLNAIGAEHLTRLTQQYAGRYLAIFAGDRFLCAARIWGPDNSGEIRIIAHLSRREAEDLAADLDPGRSP
ncbi:MAG: hypothetical protein PVJ57_02985 [Phycisphaerae bacterium]|jgi:preprotein translocase subunit SecD